MRILGSCLVLRRQRKFLHGQQRGLLIGVAMPYLLKVVQGTWDFIITMLAFWNKPKILIVFLRVLAWPPSRKRYDAARLAKG